MRLSRAICYFLCTLVASSPALAWGPEGHHTVGAIADSLIAGTHAGAEVKVLLGNIDLRDASVWADCAKSIDPGRGYTYRASAKYPECRIYQTPELEAEMSDFVQRNDKNCHPRHHDACQNQYHYTDVAIQHRDYQRTFVGTRDDDLVNAIRAAIHVLKADPAPQPFSFKGKREALLLLSHYVGDIHQPLHVGAVYLNSRGKPVNPDDGFFDPPTDTHGGNSITVHGKKENMHAMWDDVPVKMAHYCLNTGVSKQAAAFPITGGVIYDWPRIWAGDTLGAARKAFQEVKFGSLQNGHWSATLPSNYCNKMDGIKKTQLIKAGVRLAQLLQAIWP